MEENNTGFSEFAEAFGVGDYQTTESAEVEQTEETTEVEEETSSEAAEEPTATEPESDTDSGEAEEEGAESTPEPDKPIVEQKFAIKIDKETKEVGIEELKELAQKGGAFDRVKTQLTEARQSVETLKAELENSKAISDMVKRVAEDIKTTPEELLKRVNVNWRMSKGESEKEALANIAAAEANRKLAELSEKQKPAQETAQDRAKREVAEFREAYPDVEITPELMKQVAQDVQGGMPLIKAYQKIEAAKKEAEAEALRAEINKLQQQLAAEKQNKKNRANSPGSQRDSGGQATKSEFDDFLSAFG
jgi:hypothetical protein